MDEKTMQAANNPLFPRGRLQRLIIPLIIEQLLMMTVGMADTVMVTTAGEHAVAAVSLVDNINVLLIQVFAALATGGAVVVSQYLGRREQENARTAAKQLLYAVVIVSTLLTALALIFREHILALIFGHIEPAVMKSALDYFIITALAYPFMAIYNAGAALFRSMGNSKVSMFNSAIVNAVNILVNAVLIYGYGMGAAGAAIGTLVSRIVAAVVILLLLQQAENPLRIEGLFRPEFHGGMVKRILAVGIPTGVENGLFQAGKLIVLSLITSLGVGAMGTAITAANGIAGSIAGVVNVPGQAMGLAMVTVIGQCMGARQPDQAVTYAKKLVKLSYLSVGCLCVLLFFVAGPVVSIFALSPEAAAMAVEVLRWSSVFTLLFWPMSFTLPNALRAAGDAMFTMVVSLLSMFIFRVGLSYVLASAWGMNLGLLGVWLAMFSDWIIRAIIFSIRFLRGKWKRIEVI